MKREDAARLLGPPGRLSRVEKDAIFQRIDGRIGAGGRSWFSRHRNALVAATLAVSAAAVLFLVWPARSSTSELVARGSAEVPLVIRCGEREPGQCQRGDRLAFDFGSAPPAGYVALFSRAESGKVIWYVPSDEGSASVALAQHTVAGLLDSVAVIDETYEQGRYEVFAVVSPRPLSRAEIRGFAQSDRLVAPSDIQIVTRSFVIRGEETLR
jgi:hypothetical protein